MECTEIQRQIGARIRVLRKSQKITQERLAELATLHPTYVSDIELGKVNASIGSFWAIARALQIPLAEMVEDISDDENGAKIGNELRGLYWQILELDEDRRTIIVETIKSLLLSLTSV